MLHLVVPALFENSFMADLFLDPLFRAVGALGTAMALCLGFGPAAFRDMRAAQTGSKTVRDDTPVLHGAKIGTPTMGGLVMIPVITLTSLVWADLSDGRVLTVMAVAVGFSTLGMFDDLKKLRGYGQGLSKKVRIISGFSIALPAVWVLGLIADPGNAAGDAAGAVPEFAFTTGLSVPFFRGLFVDLGWFFLPFGVVLVVMGSANAVNITDGIDGLAAGSAAMVAACFGFVAWIVSDAAQAEALQVAHVVDANEITVFCAAMVGSCLGFLWFNAPPADVFMGDMGSLALGASLGTISVAVKQELLLAVIGGLFVVETLSSLAQIVSINWFGVRIFKRAPLHHHFEEQSWPETRVLVRLWIVTALLALTGLASLTA